MSTCLYTKWFAGNKNKANLATKSKFSFDQKTEQCVCMWYNNPKWITTCIDRPLTHSWEALEVVSTCVDVYKKTKLICLDTHNRMQHKLSLQHDVKWYTSMIYLSNICFIYYIIRISEWYNHIYGVCKTHEKISFFYQQNIPHSPPLLNTQKEHKERLLHYA